MVVGALPQKVNRIGALRGALFIALSFFLCLGFGTAGAVFMIIFCMTIVIMHHAKITMARTKTEVTTGAKVMIGIVMVLMIGFIIVYPDEPGNYYWG